MIFSKVCVNSEHEGGGKLRVSLSVNGKQLFSEIVSCELNEIYFVLFWF